MSILDDFYERDSPPPVQNALGWWVESVNEDGYPLDQDEEDIENKYGKYVVITPKPNQLFLDLDTEEAFIEFDKRIAQLLPAENVELKVEYSASGPPHRHVTVTVDGAKFNDLERIALQAVLGSDIIREYISVRRVFRGDENPIKFFEKVELTPEDQPRPLKI